MNNFFGISRVILKREVLNLFPMIHCPPNKDRCIYNFPVLFFNELVLGKSQGRHHFLSDNPRKIVLFFQKKFKGLKKRNVKIK